MTDIPDEAVRAAALAIEKTMFAKHELPLDAELHGKYLVTADAGLRAALPFLVPPRVADAALREKARRIAKDTWNKNRDQQTACRLIAAVDAVVALLLAPPVVVTEEMVETALHAYWKATPGPSWSAITNDDGKKLWRDAMRFTLEAALAPFAAASPQPEPKEFYIIGRNRASDKIPEWCVGSNNEPAGEFVAISCYRTQEEAQRDCDRRNAPQPQPEPAAPAPAGEERSFVYYEEAAEILPQAWAGLKPPAPDPRLAKIAAWQEYWGDMSPASQGVIAVYDILTDLLTERRTSTPEIAKLAEAAVVALADPHAPFTETHKTLSAYFHAMAERERGR